MFSFLSPRSVRSLFTLAPSSSAVPVSSCAFAPLSPSSARRSLAVLVGHLSAFLALAYYVRSRFIPWLDWVSAMGVDSVKARPSSGSTSSASAGQSASSAGSSSVSHSDVERRPSALSSLIGLTPLLSGRSLLSSAHPSLSITVPSPSARMVALRSRPLGVKAVRLVSASPVTGQRSLSQPSHHQYQHPQSAIIQSPKKRVAGFSLPSLLSPPLSRSPSAPPSPRSPSVASVSLTRAVQRSTSRMLASLHAEEDIAALAARVQLSNVLATVFAVGSLIMFLCMRALVSTSWSSFPLMIATLACPLLLAFVPALNHCGRTTLSRLLLVLLVNGSLFLFTCSTPGHGFSTLFYGCMPLPLLLFDVCLTSLPFLLSASVPLVFHLLVIVAVHSSSLYTLNSFTSSIILSAVLLHLVSSYQNTYHSLLSASRSSRSAHVAMTSLMHSISHELRTPLNAVCGYAELLLMDDALAPSQHDMVKTIADNADALTKLVSDFLTFSSSSSGQLRVDAEIMDVEEMLDGCVASHALAAHKKGLELVLEVLDDVPALVVGDGQRMREVLSNLITNSIKASLSGCIHIRVSVDQPFSHSTLSTSFSSTFTTKATTATATLVLRFDVRDEGCGITAEQQTRLFQPFQSINPAASSTQSLSSSSFGNSRGLGLAICHSLVQLMGGSIGVSSAPEKGQQGSLFYFTVQVHQVDMGEDGTPTAQSVQTSGSCDSNGQSSDAFDKESSERKHTTILPVSEGDESEDDEADTGFSVFTRPPPLHTSSTYSCLPTPLVVSCSLVRHVLLVSPNRTARDVYARIFLQTRGWLVSLCEDEQEARMRLFDSPCQSMRHIDALTGVSRATSSPSPLDELSTSIDSVLSSSASSTPRLFDCVVLDQVAGMDLAAVQRFALNIQSRLDIPCVILKMANASSPSLHLRMLSGRYDESNQCTPQSSPHSDICNTRSLFDTTDESQSAEPLSPLCTSTSSSSASTPQLGPAAFPSAPFLPRPPSLQKPRYSNVTPPASHVQQLHSLVCVLVKPVKRKVLVSKLRALMEQARQRHASKRKRELRDRMQHGNEIANTPQQQVEATAVAAYHSSAVLQHEDESVTGERSDLFHEHAEHKQQQGPDAEPFDLSILPLLPTPPPSLLGSVQQSCPLEPLSLTSLAVQLSRDSSTDSRPSPSMLRSLDRLTAAARSTSAPATHTVFVPSRPSSGCNSPIREEKEDCRHPSSQPQHHSRRSSPCSAASTTSPLSSTNSTDSSSSRSSSSSDSPSPPQPPSHSRSHSAIHASAPSPPCQSSASMPASPPTALSQVRVLVVEDTVTNQKIIARMLQRIGVSHVTIVNDGRECVQAIMGHTSTEQPQQHYHCILMDLLMPVMDGWQATERLRAAGYDLPIVALSASAMKSDRVRCDEVGCSAFLSKPTKLADLKDTLERLVLAQR